MGFSAASLFLKITFILIIVALIIQILGLALPYWYATDIGSADVYGGLFRGCAEYGNTKNCNDVDNPADWLEACQAFGIIAVLILVAALVLCIIVLFVKNEMGILKLITWILCFCAFGFILLEVIIYAAEAPAPYDEFSGAFAITIIGAIVALVAGILGLIDWLKKAPA